MSTAKVAKAIREHTRRVERQNYMRIDKAIVIRLNPLRVRMLWKREIEIEEDELILSQHVRKYDHDHDIELGDVILVTRLPVTGEYVGLTVVSPLKGLAGVRHKKAKEPLYEASERFAVNTGDNKLVKPVCGKLEVWDQDGNVVGYVPVYAEIT